MAMVSRVLQEKGHDVWSAGPDDSVFKALQLMAEKNVGALVVLEKGELVGIISERDCVRKLDLEGRTARQTLVREIMSTRVLFVTPGQTIEECMALMTDKRTRHLPVMNDGKLVGLLSIGDVVKEIVADREYTIEQLENYITGRYYSPARK